MTNRDRVTRIREILSEEGISIQSEGVLEELSYLLEGLVGYKNIANIKNEVKSRVQLEAQLSIKQNNGFGLVVMATGAGKSKVAIDYSKKIVEQNKKAKILIAVPTEKLRDENWKDEFIKWKANRIWDKNIERACYASISKIENKNYDLVILDECHNITENNSQFFKNNNIERCMALTATPPKDETKVNILKSLGLNLTYYLPLDISVNLGLVSPYNITVIECRLDDKDKYVEAGSKTNKFYQTEKKMYDWLSNSIAKLMYSNNPGKKFRIMARMRFIYNLKTKLNIAKYLIDNHIAKHERALVFCGSINQANELCKHRYHSKSPDKHLTMFKKEKINMLSCVKALNEGENIPNLDKAIIVQLTSSDKDLTQRIGRIIRYRPDHVADVYIIVAVDTVDEKWFDKATQDLDKSKMRRIRYENLISGNEKL